MKLPFEMVPFLGGHVVLFRGVSLIIGTPEPAVVSAAASTKRVERTSHEVFAEDLAMEMCNLPRVPATACEK